MSLQWTLTAFFLYVEVALVLILVLPILSPSSWKKIFNSRLAVWISTHGTLYFICFLLFLLVMFADAIREIRKYGVVVQETNIQAAPHAELNHRIKYFRAQRNLYITGFALFLWVVLKRLCVLISKEADLIEELEKPRDGKDGDELARTKMVIISTSYFLL
ncbi:B-cell receptor-associated protein 31-like [Ptychodera flava]|uniref:B-cell receptor-associated protein 31-like n=1 Tax=Ptychodera flava TaxID=63121 RepID=UPI00396AACFD